MSLRSLSAAATATALLALAPVVALSQSAAADQPTGYGPSHPFDDALMPDDGPVEPLKDQSRIERTRYGYRLTSGQQNNHITLTLVDGKLRFRDTGTRMWKGLPSSCKAENVPTGISALCRVPATTSAANPTLLEVHPRLGNDYVDARTLPAVYELAILCDEGRDIAYGGHGNDFINAAQDPDQAHGGAGNDWIRGGTGNDRIWGGTGNDYIVGQDGADDIDGGPGTNRIYP